MSAPEADLESEFDLIHKPCRHDDLACKVRTVLGGATGDHLHPG